MKKKLNKRQREEKRIAHANTYEQGFNHGFNMGYEQAKRDYEVGKWEKENHATKSGQR